MGFDIALVHRLGRVAALHHHIGLGKARRKVPAHIAVALGNVAGRGDRGLQALGPHVGVQ